MYCPGLQNIAPGWKALIVLDLKKASSEKARDLYMITGWALEKNDLYQMIKDADLSVRKSRLYRRKLLNLFSKQFWCRYTPLTSNSFNSSKDFGFFLENPVLPRILDGRLFRSFQYQRDMVPSLK